MKKITSLLLTVILLLCSFSFIMPAYAADLAKAQLDLSQYTMDDLADMSAEEYRALLREFERVYDPFDTYDTDPIMEEEEQGPQIAPRWESGDIENDEYVEEGSHEYITAKACEILTKDKGFFSSYEGANVFIVLAISIASLMPDKYENQNIFEGHFYHAVDGDSWTGSKTNTALVNCRNHFNNAVHAAQVGNIDIMYSEIGRALHYLQDAGEPHHAANITNLNPAHWQFEGYVDDRINTYIDHVTTLGNHNSYISMHTKSVDSLVKSAALNAYAYKDDVDNILNKSKWDQTAKIIVRLSVEFSAMLLYKFAYSAGLPLY